MWYLPRWDDLSERMQASCAAGHRASTEGVRPETRGRLLPLLPRYSGTAAPAMTNRRPGAYLKP